MNHEDSHTLTIDPKRRGAECGIPIRAKDGERWITADIAALDKPSLLAWLRSRGGNNPFAEDVIGILLGHGYLHED